MRHLNIDTYKSYKINCNDFVDVAYQEFRTFYGFAFYTIYARIIGNFPFLNIFKKAL